MSDWRGLREWDKRGEGIKQKNKTNPHRYRQQYGDYQREKGWGEVEEGKTEINGDKRRLDLGGKHTIQYTDDVL